jgi:two-component system chemotaxis response regulator CheY
MSQMARALGAGANEYVMKPFTRDVIADKLRLLGLTQ